jgi:hypothetical protein
LALDNAFVVKKGLNVGGPTLLTDTLSVSGNLYLSNDLVKQEWRDELQVPTTEEIIVSISSDYMSYDAWAVISGNLTEKDPIFASMSGMFALRDLSAALIELTVFEAVIGNLNGFEDYTDLTAAIADFEASNFGYAIFEVVGNATFGSSIVATKPFTLNGRLSEFDGVGGNITFSDTLVLDNNIVEIKNVKLIGSSTGNSISLTNGADTTTSLSIKNGQVLVDSTQDFFLAAGNRAQGVLLENVTISGGANLFNTQDTASVCAVLYNTNSQNTGLLTVTSSTPSTVKCVAGTVLKNSALPAGTLVSYDASSTVVESAGATYTKIDRAERVGFTSVRGLISTNVSGALDELALQVVSISGYQQEEIVAISANYATTAYVNAHDFWGENGTYIQPLSAYASESLKLETAVTLLSATGDSSTGNFSSPGGNIEYTSNYWANKQAYSTNYNVGKARRGISGVTGPGSANANDGNTSTWFAPVGNWSVSFDLTTPVAITHSCFVGWQSGTYSVYGSNTDNDLDWVLIKAGLPEVDENTKTALDNTTAYRYYRVDGPGSNYCYEIMFFVLSTFSTSNTVNTNTTFTGSKSFAPATLKIYNESNVEILGSGKLNVAYSINGGAFSSLVDLETFKLLSTSIFASITQLSLQVQPVGSQKFSKVDISTTSGSVILTPTGDAYTTINGLEVHRLSLKANAADVYTKTESDLLEPFDVLTSYIQPKSGNATKELRFATDSSTYTVAGSGGADGFTDAGANLTYSGGTFYNTLGYTTNLASGKTASVVGLTDGVFNVDQLFSAAGESIDLGSNLLISRVRLWSGSMYTNGCTWTFKGATEEAPTTWTTLGTVVNPADGFGNSYNVDFTATLYRHIQITQNFGLGRFVAEIEAFGPAYPTTNNTIDTLNLVTIASNIAPGTIVVKDDVGATVSDTLYNVAYSTDGTNFSSLISGTAFKLLSTFSGVNPFKLRIQPIGSQIVASVAISSPSNESFMTYNADFYTKVNGVEAHRLSLKATGPEGAVDSNIAVFNGTTGKIIKDSGVGFLAEYVGLPPNWNSSGSEGQLNYDGFYMYYCTVTGISGSGRWIRWPTASTF